MRHQGVSLLKRIQVGWVRPKMRGRISMKAYPGYDGRPPPNGSITPCG